MVFEIYPGLFAHVCACIHNTCATTRSEMKCMHIETAGGSFQAMTIAKDTGAFKFLHVVFQSCYLLDSG